MALNEATLIHLKDGTPTVPTGYRNVKWQQSAPYNSTAVFNNQTIDVSATDVSAYEPNMGGVDARTTATETIGLASMGKLVTLGNSGATAVTLDSSTAPAFFVCFVSVNGAGTCTLTPSSGTITVGSVTGAALALLTSESCILFFNGTNWFAMEILAPTEIATRAGVQAETYNFATDTGTANAYAIAPSPAIAAYAAGQEFAFIVAHTNTLSSTLAVSGLTAKTIQKWVSGSLTNLAAGDATAGQIFKVKYDGTVFQVVGGLSASGTGTVTHTGTLTSGQLIVGNGGVDIKVGDLSGDVSTAGGTATTLATVTVPKGGTGLTSITAHDVLVGAGASAVVPVSPSTSGFVLTSNGTGSDPSFQVITPTIGGSGGGFAWGGDSSDSALAFDGTNTFSGIATTTGAAPNLVYTLIRDVMATTVTISSGITVKSANYRIFATVSVTVNGTLHNNGSAGAAGGAGQNSSSGSAGSLQFPISTIAFGPNGIGGGAGGTTNGSQAGASNVGNNSSRTVAAAQFAPSVWTSGKGGDVGANTGGAARNSGTNGSITASLYSARILPAAITGVEGGTVNPFSVVNTAGGGAGGGGGAGDGANVGASGGQGGGAGGCGGIMIISAPTITVGASGTISANGAAAGNGSNGGNAVATGTGRGGGGGGGGGCGGNGGLIWLVYHSYTNSGTVQCVGGSGGTHGTGGNGFGTGANGANGQDGPTGGTGVIIQIAQ